MKQLVPQLLTFIIAWSFYTLGCIALIMSAVSIIQQKFFGLEQKYSDKKIPSEIKYTYILGLGCFIVMAFVFCYNTLHETGDRWIDIPYKIGMLINGMAILHVFYFNNRSRFVSRAIYCNTVLFSITTGMYIGIEEISNALTGLIIYTIMAINSYEYNRIRRKRDMAEEIKNNGIDIDGFHVKIKITEHGPESVTD